MKAKTMQDHSRPSGDDIAALAKHIWEQIGRPDGEDIKHWLQAELFLVASFRQPSERRVEV